MNIKQKVKERLAEQGVFMSEEEATAVRRQLADSYEFLYNKLGSDHPETWECYQQWQRAIRGWK